MKALHSLVNVVPVIAKSDTSTEPELSKQKTRVRNDLINRLIGTPFSLIIQIMQDILDNQIRIYNGTIDEEDDSPEIQQIIVRICACNVALIY